MDPSLHVAASSPHLWVDLALGLFREPRLLARLPLREPEGLGVPCYTLLCLKILGDKARRAKRSYN